MASSARRASWCFARSWWRTDGFGARRPRSITAWRSAISATRNSRSSRTSRARAHIPSFSIASRKAACTISVMRSMITMPRRGPAGPRLQLVQQGTFGDTKFGYFETARRSRHPNRDHVSRSERATHDRQHQSASVLGGAVQLSCLTSSRQTRAMPRHSSGSCGFPANHRQARYFLLENSICRCPTGM